MQKINGTFYQRDYGFSVVVPSDALGFVTKGGDAEHGILLVLGERRKIVVYPEYTSSDWRNEVPCRAGQFSWEATSSRYQDNEIVDGHPACRVTFRSSEGTWRVVQATGKDRGTSIMYTLILTTTRKAEDADFVSFDHVTSSFRRRTVIP